MRGIKRVKKVHYKEMLFERRNWLANVGCVPYAYNQDGHTDECLDDGGPRMYSQSFSFCSLESAQKLDVTDSVEREFG
jgi:hypothetical protein